MDDDNEVHLWNHGEGKGAPLTNNIHGQCVKKSTITEEISQHSLNGNPEGVYYLRVYQGNSIHKGKLLLKY